MIPLQRNLIVFDLETTSADPKTARIVEIAMLVVSPQGDEKPFRMLVNPGCPIPKAASDIHGITDEKVKDARTFSSVAERLAGYFAKADVAGYNVRFDLSVLAEEFKRCGIEFTFDGAIVDGFRFWQILEPRTLSDAVERFVGVRHESAHSADGDVDMTWQVLKKQLVELAEQRDDRGEAPITSVQALHDLLWPRPANAVDDAGKVVWINGVACLGPWSKKHGGRPLAEVPKDYFRWILDNDFPPSTKNVIRAALIGSFPTKAKEAA